MIFFFFYFYDIHTEPIIQKAFDMVCGKKLKHDGYCDMSEYISAKLNKNEIYQLLSESHSPFLELYDNSYPTENTAYEMWRDFVNRNKSEKPDLFDNNNSADIPLSYVEAKAIINWVYRAYKTKEKREEQTKELFSYITETYSVFELDFINQIIFIRSRVDINIVQTVEDYIKNINLIQEEDTTVFYRGHSNVNYILQPSIMRSSAWICHEHDMHNEIIIECPEDFENCSSHLDYLVLMQHYGMPTRLLDVTKNPLVALYFACVGDDARNGEIIILCAPKDKIKYPRSDTVSVLSSLSLLDSSTKESLLSWINGNNSADAIDAKNKLLHEIQNEKPAFEDKITGTDIGDCFFVLAAKKNSRIANQDGAFIICGLLDDTGTSINKYRYSENAKIQIFVIDQKCKKDILSKLNKLSINKARLFPEIEDVSLYIKSKY